MHHLEVSGALRPIYGSLGVKRLNTELNPICHLLALLGVHHILHVGRIRVKLAISSQFLPTPTYGEMAQLVTQITGIIDLDTNYDILVCVCKIFSATLSSILFIRFFFFF